MAQQREEMAKELAENIMTLARNTLMVHLRFMDRAISHLTLTCDGEIPFATDGRALYYEPWTVLQRYQAEPNAGTYTAFRWVHPSELGLVELTGDDKAFLDKYDPWINGRTIPDVRMY